MRVRAECLVADVLHPLGERAGLPWGVEVERHGPGRARQHAKAGAAGAVGWIEPIGGPKRSPVVYLLPVAPPARLVCAAAPSGESGVHMSLKRDYHILVNLMGAVKSGINLIKVSEISNWMTLKGGYFHGHSRRSSEQAVAHVVKKCVAKALENRLDAPAIEYKKCAAGGCAVYMEGAGGAVLLNYLREACGAMERGDSQFGKSWHASRSSRSKARSAAVSKIFKER